MRAIQVRCPNCGASLAADADAAAVTCSYCGTSSRIQTRSRVFQVPRPLPPAPDAAPRPVARQRVNGAVMAVPFLVISVAIASSVMYAGSKAGQGVIRQLGGGGPALRWSGDVPVLADVDGDGADDLIGFSRYVLDGDRMHLAAISGATGALLWESPRLGTYTEVYQGVVAAAGDRVLLATSAGALAGFDRATGQPRWEAQLGEKVAHLCAGEPGTIVVGTADERWHTVALDSGSRRDRAAMVIPDHRRGRPKRAAEASQDVCAPLATSQRETMPGLFTLDSWSELPTVDGMRLERIARRGDGPLIGIGTKQPGTAVPMVAVLEPKPGWRAQVAATSPLDSRAEDHLVTITADAVVAVYQPPDGPPHVTAFELADGRRRWDRPVRKGLTIVMTGLVTTGSRVVLSSWGHLQGFDLATGEPVFTIGQF
ncbi:MAG TPA: PQQ-binding-like beta-propeller repeat protein [Kofleriaceae bacterium]|nr:PQQ-binding-like beta-propeller repeat protein [Kofleriaceae bacterium]